MGDKHNLQSTATNLLSQTLMISHKNTSILILKHWESAKMKMQSKKYYQPLISLSLNRWVRYPYFQSLQESWTIDKVTSDMMFANAVEKRQWMNL